MSVSNAVGSFPGVKADLSAFVTFLTAGFPTADSTVPLMLALEAGGADVIELGIPFSDPIADGPVIQQANTVSRTICCDSRIDMSDCRWLSRTMCTTSTV